MYLVSVYDAGILIDEEICQKSMAVALQCNYEHHGYEVRIQPNLLNRSTT